MKPSLVFIITLLTAITITLFSCLENPNQHKGLNGENPDSQTEWTEWLNRYESLVEKNNQLQKRAKSGDMTALQEITSVSTELVETSQKCQDNKNSMSSSEAKRLIKIINKIKY